ncbi:MAG: DUF4342 domain-containing protein [Methylocystaceae bacterium]
MDSKWEKWSEQIEVTADELVSKVKELIAEGNVHRLMIYNSSGDKLMEIPVTAGLVVGGVVTILAPLLMAIGALTALFANFRIEIERRGL